MKSRLTCRSLGIALAILLASAISSSAQSGTLQPQRVKSHAQLWRLLRNHHPRYYAGYRTGLTVLANAAMGATGNGVAYSSMLVQADGVDEGDIVKNDSSYIYQINQDRVLVIHAFPDSDLGVVNVLDFTDGSFYPQELYLDSQFLVVVGTAFEPSINTASPMLVPIWFFSTSTVKALVYDIADPSHPTKVRELEIEGDWVATRKIGSSLYLVARQYPQFYPMLAAGVSRAHTVLPRYRDTARGSKFHKLSISRCYYFPGFDDPNYLLIGAIDLSDPNSQLDLNAYLGAGDQVYASTQNLYVTGSRPFDIFFMPQLTLVASPAVTGAPTAAVAAGQIAVGTLIVPLPPIFAPTNETTDIYKFSLTNSHTAFVAGNDVPGSILSSYSMDENGAFFRVATTQHAWWNATNQDNNNLFVLDTNMTIVGSVTNVAAGERIYAARFVGDRAFLVTFQQIDPLFAIDLSNPTNPVVVGQLTLPGYSNFLLPYDANHLIGFGKDVTVATNQTAGDVPWWDGAAFYQGMKLSMFDVTDLHNPVLLHSLSIGDRGTDSPVLYDPHALLFDRSSNLLAFPISVAQLTNSTPDQPWQWGDTVFQGVQVYDVSFDRGFVLRGSITQIPEDADIWENWDRQIDRVLFIGSDLFTLSDAELKVNDLGTLADKTELQLPPLPDTSGSASLMTVQPILP